MNFTSPLFLLVIPAYLTLTALQLVRRPPRSSVAAGVAFLRLCVIAALSAGLAQPFTEMKAPLGKITALVDVSASVSEAVSYTHLTLPTKRIV